MSRGTLRKALYCTVILQHGPRALPYTSATTIHWLIPRQTTLIIIVIIWVSKVLIGLKLVRRATTGSKVITRVVIIGFIAVVGAEVGDTLHGAVGADGRRTAFVVVRADVVGVVAHARLPPIAGCPEVELPPHTIEDGRAGRAAVHLGVDGERRHDAEARRGIGRWRVDLQTWRTESRVGRNCSWHITRAGRGLFIY